MIADQKNLSVPCFTFESSSGVMSFETLKGNWVVLYFYPKDNTPGCTQESKDFRDQFKDFQDTNTIILGVSRDSIKSHHKFIDKYDLPFTLISDPEEKLCQHFGVIKMKSMFGKKYLGIERSTFLINDKGIVVREWRKVKISGHVKTVLEAIQSS